MRNLKKFLALALAMVMAFSLMLSASAADQVKDWTDKDQVTKEFTKAVDVLSGMEIFQGDDRGFAPGDSITRAEVAALVYRAATGDVTNARAEMYRTYAPFTDVKADDWFAGYVGYCWNAGYIKGTTATTFNPYQKVTGYEVLAMILRAVGYDRNHEFEGGQWIVNVASIANDKKVTKDVKTTIYGDTLHTAARRDVVASLLFNAIQIDTVTYTPALGYETDRLNGTNKSLGEIWFNLKKTVGIVVGNQDTGETMTRVNSLNTDSKTNGGATAPAYAEYFHNTNNWNESTGAGKMGKTTNTDVVDAKTGIDMFGHKVEVWHNSVSHKTFALYDNVVKTALVTASTPILSGGTHELGDAAVAAGFNVDLQRSKAVFNQEFGVSGSRAAITGTESVNDSDYVANGNNATVGSGAISVQGGNDPGVAGEGVESVSEWGANGGYNGDVFPLYLLISNSADNKVDMVIALNIVTTNIDQVNDYGKYPTVTNTLYPGYNTAWNDKTNDMIEQKALTASSTKNLGDGVVGVAIRGTNVFSVDDQLDYTTQNDAAGFTPTAGSVGSATAPLGNTPATANYFYRLSKPTSVIEGTVTGYKHNATGANAATTATSGSIIIDGKEVKRSLLAETIVGYCADTDSAGPHTWTTFNRGLRTDVGSANCGLSPDVGNYGEYRLYLDAEGKYIWAEPIKKSDFIYGTYVDYTTPYGSSAYEYTMIGVDLEGKQVKRVVTSLNGTKISAAMYSAQVDNDRIEVGELSVPYRDTLAGVSAVTPNTYRGFTITEKGALTGIVYTDATVDGGDETDVAGHATHTPSALDGDPVVRIGSDILAEASTTPLTITSDAAKLGMADTKAKDAAGQTTKFFTNNTKFIVVDGAGTDTQKVKVYNGLTEFLDGAGSVTIDTAALARPSAYLEDVITLEKMVYYTQSPFTYASVSNRTYQVDTIILPAKAISRQGMSNLVYMGSTRHDSMTSLGAGTDVWLYTFYDNGEAKQYWIEDDAHTALLASSSSNIGDVFMQLAATADEMPNGDPIWTLVDQDDNDPSDGTWDPGIAAPTPDANGRPDTLNGQFPIIYAAEYWAATYAAQTASIGADVTGTLGTDYANFNVSNAKVVNVNAKNSGTGLIWPTITDLGSLNAAASTADVYNGQLPQVSCLVDPANPMNVTVIYVQFDQT